MLFIHRIRYLHESAMAEEFRVLRPFEYHCHLISKKQRADGRGLDNSREVRLETDAITTADASSLVKLGNTSLICGCKARLLPDKDQAEPEDRIKLRIELPPICSSPIGRHTQNTEQLLTKALKDILDDTNCIDERDLILPSIKSYWSLEVEVICLNYDGSLLDAALIAVLSALRSIKFKNDTMSDDIISSSIHLNSLPICTSFAVIGGHTICDPNLEEESIAQSSFSITVDPTQSSSWHIRKVGGQALGVTELERCMDIAKQRADKLQSLLQSIES